MRLRNEILEFRARYSFLIHADMLQKVFKDYGDARYDSRIVPNCRTSNCAEAMNLFSNLIKDLRCTGG